jgi:hypothetical protein
MERRILKGLLLLSVDSHLSDKLPKIGVRKKPSRVDRNPISVMWD